MKKNDWNLKYKLKPAKFGIGLKTGYLQSDIDTLRQKLIEDIRQLESAGLEAENIPKGNMEYEMKSTGREFAKVTYQELVEKVNKRFGVKE